MKDILRAVVFGGLFIIPFLTLIVSSNLFFPYITGKNFAFRIIVEVLVASWLLLALLDARYRPKFSYILVTLAVFMGVTLISTLFAEHVHTAFWSNYERMEGYITILHVFGYFLVLGNTFTEKKHWIWFFRVSIAVAVFVAFKGLVQLASSETGSLRIDSTLGNSTYMAVYMLFQLGFLAYLFLQTKSPLLRFIYSALSVMFLFVLIQTGTRGTAIGLAVGVVTAIAYISLFGAKEPALRKYAVGAILLLVIAVAGFIGLRDSQFVQNSPNLARIANIDLKADLAIRSIVWSMAYEGVKERPILGWGMGNYNYIFNKHYDPRMYAQEQWFDRVHNLVLDWLVAGGVVGLLAYLAIFASLIYYLFVRPYFYNDQTFSVAESAVLIGLLVGYFTHNLVVFDNIVSYIFFASTIAYIHFRVATPVEVVQKFKLSPAVTTQIVFPVVVLGLIAVVYVVNVPAILSAYDMISALKTNDMEKRYEYFDQAFARGTYAKQEVVEQFVQQAISISHNTNLPEETRSLFLVRTEQELGDFIKTKPGDALMHTFFASFYRSIGNLEKAKVQLAIARELSPNKQWIIIQQGAVALSLKDNETARDYFETAFLLDERFTVAREYYVASLFMTGDTKRAKELINEGGAEFYDEVATSDLVVGSANLIGDTKYVVELYERRLELDPKNAQEWMKLAVLYYQVKDNKRAVEAMAKATTLEPKLKSTADCIVSNINAGRDPQTPCQQ